MTTGQEQKDLEVLVDMMTLTGVLDMLATICDEKADHVLTNWQDSRTAKVWYQAAFRLSQLSKKIKT